MNHLLPLINGNWIVYPKDTGFRDVILTVMFRFTTITLSRFRHPALRVVVVQVQKDAVMNHELLFLSVQ